MMQAGWAKTIVTPNVFGTLMMGYANEKNKVLQNATELYCRSIWMKGDGFNLLYLYLDINYITSNLHRALVSKICSEYDIREAQINICASHTHSAHGSYGDKLYYEVPTDGFKQEVFESFVSKSLVAVKLAYEDLGDAKLTFGSAAFSGHDKVAFNRSMESFYKNPEALGNETNENALNLNMDQVHLIKDSRVAVINWFGCHTTSIPNFLTSTHFDNKGYACKFMEEYLGDGSLAIFAQATSGDVTPNYCWDANTKQMRGPYEDYDKNAQFNGNLQYSKSREIYENAQSELKEDIKSLKQEFCFRDLFSNDGTMSLGPASFGTSFMVGTLEGPGVSKIIVWVVAVFLKILRGARLTFTKVFSPESYRYQKKVIQSHGAKNIFLNVSDREFAGFSIKHGIPLLHLIDPQVKKLNNLLKLKMYQKAHSWYEEHLPLQLVKIDSLLIVAVPFELTTISGRRIIAALKKSANVKRVILNAYANGYAGYITTPEEYENQAYEGGHTVFGRASLPILIEKLEKMSMQLQKG